MAEESVELPVISEESKSSRVEVRSYSAGKASSENSNKKVVSRYLKPCIGSCHDICKFGREQAIGTKERRSIPDRATRKKLYQSLEGGNGGIMISVDSKSAKMSLAKLEKPVDSDTSDSKKQELPIKSSVNKKQTRNEGLVKKKKTSLVKVKPSLMESRTSSSARQETSSTAKEVESSSESASNKVKTPSKSTSEEVETPSKPNSKKVKTPSESTSKKMGTRTPLKSTSRVETSLKSTAKMVKTPSKTSTLKGNGKEPSAKSVTSLKPISVPRKITSLNSSEGFGGQRNRDIKMEKGAVPSKAASRKLMKPSTAPLSPKVFLKRVPSINSKKHRSLKIMSQLKNQQTANAIKVDPEELNNDEVEEKTLYVIKMESENKTLQSDHNSSYNDEPSLPQISTPNFASSSKFQPLSQEGQEESEYTTIKHKEDSVSQNHEEYMENGKTLEVVVKGKPRKGGIVYSEDKDGQMLKLKFRKGRMIENKIENNSPRRLKFRKTKVYQKAHLADSQRKSFKRRDEACVDSTGATPGPEHVVLRHQDKKDKKGAQGLFNNVIEETASKLVETRKSKVKALVGAFETVISLQDKNPASNTAS